MTRAELITRYARERRRAPRGQKATELWLALRNATTDALCGRKQGNPHQSKRKTDMKLTSDSIGKAFKTRDGKKAWVLDYDAPAYCGVVQDVQRDFSPAWWFSGGHGDPKKSSIDLISEWKDLQSGEGWVNVYPDGPDQPYNTKDEADDGAGSVRIARVRFTWTEGQYD